MARCARHTLEARQDLRSLGILLDVLNVVNKDGHLREEWVVLGELVRLFVVAAGSADVKDWRNVWVHEPRQIPESADC